MTLFTKSLSVCAGALLATGILFTGFCSADEEHIAVVERPSTKVANVNYTASRAPLKPLQFIKLPVGSIQPEGWLRKYLELQRDGLTGHLGEISAWLEKNDNAWLTAGGQHGWEEVPYWLKGYGNLAYILNDPKMIAETKVWLEGVFKSVQPDGYFGPVNERDGRRELWANMIMLWCMQSYYEYSGDQRVIDLMTNYFKWQLTVDDSKFLRDYWENSRGGDNLWSVYWLYNITGDSFLLELAEKISDRILCVNGRAVDRIGTPEEVMTAGYITQLYGIRMGSYDEGSSDMELAAPEGTPQVFVIAGAGSGRKDYRRLQRAGVPFATGILYENDLDYPVAKALAAEVITEHPFEPVAQEKIQVAKKTIDKCKRVICCRENFGSLETFQRELLEYAEQLGKQIEKLERPEQQSGC